MEWVNPHAWLYIDVDKPDGKTERWAVEFGSPNVLFRNGWKKGFAASEGMRVTVQASPAKDGSLRANSRGVEFPDGRKLGAPAAAPAKTASSKFIEFKLMRKHFSSRCARRAVPRLRADAAGWNDPFPPHKIMDNMYYVGTKELATFLFVTPQGLLLMNSNYEASVPVIKANVEELGFKFSDVKILIAGHAHPGPRRRRCAAQVE